MTETQIEAPAKPVKRRKYKRAKKAAAPRVAKQTSPFAGLTKSACATACNAQACVISGKPYCAHPAKGGLQAGDLGNTELAQRAQEAAKVIKRQALS